MDNWTDSMCFDNCPDAVGNARHGHDVCLYRKKMPDLVNGEPDGRQTAHPEDEKTNKVSRVGSGACRHAVGEVGITWPDSSKHECDALSYATLDFSELGLEQFVQYIPPIHDCTPYQMQAMAALLNTGQSEPQIPKDARMPTGKLIWYVAPIRAVMQMKVPEMKYPIQTQSHDCHHDSPPMIIEDDIIHVFYPGSV